MDFLVGVTGKVVDASEAAKVPKNNLEARVLAIREARRSPRQKGGTERRASTKRRRDPVGGRVLVLLVPEGAKLPAGLENGEFRVFLRFKKR